MEAENRAPITNRAGANSRYPLRNRNKAAKPANGTRRRALGDISNRRQANVDNTKKATKGGKKKGTGLAAKEVTKKFGRATRANRRSLGNKPSTSTTSTRGVSTRGASRRASLANKKKEGKKKRARQADDTTGDSIASRTRKRSKTHEEKSEQVEEIKAPAPVETKATETPEPSEVQGPNTARREVADLVNMIETINVVEDGHALSEYAEDVYLSNRQIENLYTLNPTYMSRQGEITPRMRQKLIDWLIDLHKRFRLEPETLYLGINILDRFLENNQVYKNTFQLVGCTALLLASKYEEIYPPVAQDFVYMSANAFTREELLQMETVVLNELGFNLTVPSMLSFSSRFLNVVGVRPDQEMIRNQVQYFMELTLEHYDFLQFSYSEIATTATFMALRLAQSRSEENDAGFDVPSAQPRQLELLLKYSGYSLSALKPCLAKFKKVLETPPRYDAVRRKFSQASFGAVAELDYAPTFEGLGLE